MKKIRLLNTVLWLSISCVAVNQIAVAKEKTSHKKRSSTQNLKMTERNINECTQLLNKVAETDKKIHEDMKIRQTRAMQSSAFLAATNPITVNKTAVPPVQQQVNKTITQAVTVPAQKTVAVAKPATATIASVNKNQKPLPAGTQVFAADDPRAIAHLTGKITTPIMATPDYYTYTVKTSKPRTTAVRAASSQKVVKTTTTKPKSNITTTKTSKTQPRIELFAPNSEAVDLNHLEGKSADLDNLKKSKKPTPNKSDKTAPEKTPKPNSSSVAPSTTKKKTS